MGNSRLHWALFHQEIFLKAWHTSHLSHPEGDTPPPQSGTSSRWPSHIEQAIAPYNLTVQDLSGLWIASVVPSQTQLWQTLNTPNLSIYWVNRDAIPFEGIYPSLGIDRLLTLWGAGVAYGWPTLVIDAGTALTFTAGLEHQLVGGAILPGMQLQLKALAQNTGALPRVSLPETLPARWAKTTIGAIQSGIVYTALATIQDYCHHWTSQYPHSSVILTGGDGEMLYHSLTAPWAKPSQDSSDSTLVSESEPPKDKTPMPSTGVHHDPYLMFWGIRAYRHLTQRSNARVIG